MQLGATALISAASEGHTECVYLLVEDGADKDAQDHVRIVIAWRLRYEFFMAESEQ